MVRSILKRISLFLLLTFSLTHAKTADLVTFSYNRPMQLYAFLESVDLYVTNLKETHVIYRASDDTYEKGYQIVKETFPDIVFYRQGKNPKKDFKPLTLKASFKSPSKYIIFAVDDIIITDFIDINEGIKYLKNIDAYGFFYRLGKNITFNYPRNAKDKVPELFELSDDIYQWCFKSARQGYWRYPNTVDLTLYAKKDIRKDLKSLPFTSPNTLEGRWHTRSGKVIARNALCYQHSKMINIPVNLVQSTFRNRNTAEYTPKELLEIFNNGMKIDIAAFFKINNKSSHMDYPLPFIER